MKTSEELGITMPPRLIESRAFRAAALQSEVRRAYAVIALIVLIMAMLFFRGSQFRMPRVVQFVGLAGIIILFVMQAGVLLFARAARRRQENIPLWFIVLGVAIEMIIPAGMIVCLVVFASLPPYAALNSPALLVYELLIIMTTLRLRPGLCALAGFIGASGYAIVFVYVYYVLHIAVPTTGLPKVAYPNFAILIFASGLGAAWVARELRGHVEAALDEAQTRREVDRMENDLSVARSIQRSLLPTTAPKLANFDIAGWNRPADQTGGDYYDWQMLPGGNCIVTVADVSGHGIGPAMVTAACRAYVRASGEYRGDLASLTSRINRLLADDLLEGRFVTMVSVLIDPRDQSLALLSAGHGPIVKFVQATQTVEEIIPQDLPLAIERERAYGPAQAIPMKPGDVLALVTDGFVEWPRYSSDGRREEYGLARLSDALGRNAHLPATQMIEAITADVAEFARPTPQQDDLTMVIIRRLV